MGQWLERRSMPTPRHDLQSVAVNGSIYAISGADDLTLHVVEVYDVANDAWIQGPPIPTARGWLGADLLDGRIYVAGGKTIQTSEMRIRTGLDYHFISRDCLEVLDVRTQQWSVLEPMPRGHRAGVSVVACAGKIWVIGGNTMDPRDQRIVDRVEVYDPQAAEWSDGPSLPRPLQGPGVAAWEGRVHVFGGCTDKDPDNQFRDEQYVLDPAVGKWEPLAPQPTGRESQGVALLDGCMYTFGGRDPSYTASNEIYDFARDSWTVAEPMPVGKAWLDACTAGDRLFAMGGAYALPGGGHKWIHDLHEYVP